jgi:hypothetical protein
MSFLQMKDVGAYIFMNLKDIVRLDFNRMLAQQDLYRIAAKEKTEIWNHFNGKENTSIKIAGIEFQIIQ